jgi:hypothetical protein
LRPTTHLVCFALLSPALAQPTMPACTLPPAGTPVPVPRYVTGSFNNDSHQYNPYSSVDNDKAGLHHDAKQPGENGHWVTNQYQVACGGADGMYRDTYLRALIVDSKGGLACETGPNGNFLSINNGSSKYPAYFGLASVLNDKLLPGEKKTINVSAYHNVNRPGVPFAQTVTLKYWTEDSAGVRCKTAAEYNQYLVAHKY